MTSVRAANAPPPAPTAGIFDRTHRAATFGMVALVSLIAFESMAVTTAMPTVARELDGLSAYALAFAAALATGVIGMVFAGAWIDRVGPRAPMWTGLVLFVGGLLIAGSVSSMELVALGRGVQGLGGGMVAVALYVVVARAYPEELRGKVFAGLSAAWVVPALVGPALAGVVVEVLGWRWVFLGVPVVVILPVLALRRTLTRLPSQEVVAPWPRARLLNAVGAAGGAVLLHVASQQEGLGRVALIGAGLAVLAVCTPRLLPAGTWRVRRGLPTVIALRGLVGAGFTAAEVFVPLLLSRERGLSPSLAGLVLTAAAITWASGSWLRSRAGLQHRNALVLRLGAAAIAIGIMLAAAVVSEAVPVFVAMIGWAVGGLGMGMIYPTLSVLTLQLSPVSEQGLNTSALQLNDSLSAVVALALSGVLYAGLIDATPVVAYVACFGAALVLVLLAFVVAPRVNPRAEGAG